MPPSRDQPKSKVSSDRSVFMIVDPLTREAYREGDDPASSGPLFFTSREAIEAYVREESIEDYVLHELPEGVLSRMKGKPHWVDGKPA